MVIDCTTSAPDDADITCIKNTATHVAEIIPKVNVIPLIVSSEDCSSMKLKSPVSIIDKENCEYICDLILKGHVIQAREFFKESLFGNHEQP